MPDIAKCRGEDCLLKETCYRYTSEPNEHWQAYGNFLYNKETNECEYYWKVYLKKMK